MTSTSRVGINCGGVRPKAAPAAFLWPNLGYTKDRRRYFPASSALRPPFRTRWRVPGRVLLELPPVIYRGFLYSMTNQMIIMSALQMRFSNTRTRN